MSIQYISHEQNESNHKRPVKVKTIIILILGYHCFLHKVRKKINNTPSNAFFTQRPTDPIKIIKFILRLVLS